MGELESTATVDTPFDKRVPHSLDGMLLQKNTADSCIIHNLHTITIQKQDKCVRLGEFVKNVPKAI